VLLSFTGCGGDEKIVVGDKKIGGGQMVENGDIVIINYVGMLHGIPFENGSAENVRLVIGSGEYIPGFEDQIIGMNVGGVRNIAITFPEEYHAPELEGKDVIFEITLHSIRVLEERSGTFVLELYPEYAPQTVDNFVKLVSDGFYDGLTFHRIVDEFMAQGGGFTTDGSKKDAEQIFGEFAANGFEQNTLSHTAGVISMARLGNDNNSASSEFFICFTNIHPLNTNTLDGEYAAFGKVTNEIDGMDLIDSLQQVERTLGFDYAMSSPLQPIIIKKMTLLENDGGNPKVQVDIEYQIEV
jgi:cyclophilin family peptidyl-prolyl cis-trans isomerase